MSPFSDGPWISMSLVWGLLVLAGLGDGLYRILRRAGFPAQAPRPEAVGLRILFALAAVPWAVLSLDLTGIPVDRLTLTVWSLLLFLAGLRADGRVRLRPRPQIDLSSHGSGPPSDAGDRPEASLLSSPAALLLALGAASLIFFSLIHVSLIPVRAYDALVGYDLVGKIMACEGKLRSTVFSRIVFNAQCVYGPFTSTNSGFWYLFHPPIPRLWIPLIYGGFLLVYWSKLRRWTGSPTAASLASFLVLLPSSFAFQLTEAQTDTPCLVFTALALFALVDLLKGKGRAAPLWIFLLISATARTENLLFGLACSVILFGRRPTRHGRSLLPVLAPAAFFLFWNLFYVRHLIGYDPGAYFRPFDLDPGRILEVLRRACQITAEPGFFGEFPWLLLVVPLLWVLGRWPATSRRLLPPGVAPDFDHTGAILLISLIMFLLYMPYFYMWNEGLNPLWTMEHTYKRGFLRFVPGIVAALVSAPVLLRWFRRCDGPRH